jgi:hypothetical protein
MPVLPPDLDDLRYERVRQQLRARIPVYAPEWTDHNDSDPGVAILQLFAWLTDQVGYRLNRVPDRNYVAFLQLLGVQLRPAAPATTTLALVLSTPDTLPGRIALAAGSTSQCTVGEKPTFETDIALDIVPAQLGAMLTTVADDLRLLDPDGSFDPSDPEGWIADNLTVAWDGKTPKLEEMPARPVAIGQYDADPTHSTLWLGLVFNRAAVAGFVGQRVTMTLQLDDDERPDVLAHATCGEMDAEAAGAEVAYRWYRPRQPGEAEGAWITLRPVLDTTSGFARSGVVKFDVPAAIGPIPDAEWGNLLTVAPRTLEEICVAAEADPGEILAGTEPHPLPGKLKVSVPSVPLKVPMSGWIAVSWPGGNVPARSIRQVTFNAVPATAARTVSAELLGTGNGKPGQSLSLAHTNIVAGTLELQVEDLRDNTLHDWAAVADFDGVGPDAEVYVLDAEAGTVRFGDGVRGRPPSLRTRVVAARYRWGGGEATEVPVATITQPSGWASVTKTTNLYGARGGRDAETLAEAKARVPQELKVLGRAVTAADYRFFALQTPGVRVARAEVVPLRRPFSDPDLDGPGLDHVTKAAGAIAVIVVPDEAGATPRPTTGMLRTVCEALDAVRLVTTEVHVVPPMYVRLHDWDIEVIARPGWSVGDVRDAVVAELEGWLHVLANGGAFPFGAVLPHSEILARLFRLEGVQRIERLVLHADGFAPDVEPGVPGEQIGRDERRTAITLTNCPTSGSATEVDRLDLAPDEIVFVDPTTLALEVRYE